MDIYFDNEIPSNNFSSIKNLNNINKQISYNSNIDNSFPNKSTFYTFSQYEDIEDIDEKKEKKFEFIKETIPISIMSSCERRLIKDIDELKKNKNIGKVCEIKINDYEKNYDEENFQMKIEFVNYFSIKFIFSKDYPFEPPIISYYSGKILPFVFDPNGNIILENIKKSKWTPIIWLSTIVKTIELLILKYLNNNMQKDNILFIPKKMKYVKRKWDDYLKEEKYIFKNNNSTLNELSKTIKRLKYLSI